jgi:hypothetical protein
MGHFDTGQGNGRTLERLEASYHRGASAFDRSMILLNKIVEVLITSHDNILPLRILAPQKPKSQSHVTLQVRKPFPESLGVYFASRADLGQTVHAQAVAASPADPSIPWFRHLPSSCAFHAIPDIDDLFKHCMGAGIRLHERLPE